MDKVLRGPSKSSPTSPPRFRLGNAAGGSLVACLWLWTSAGALAAAASEPISANPAAASAYRSALDSFNHGDDSRALALLEHAPTGGTPAEQADLLNLRGAIFLRQGHYDQAQGDFARAARADHSLWAARFNEAEVSFRQKRYAESRRQFAALLGQTSRLFHKEEYHFVQYKLLLAGVCAGDEKPALDFIADYRDDAQPPQAWYYLNAALERRHGRAGNADQWLAQADSKVGTGTGHPYADSFARLGWRTPGRAGISPGREEDRGVRNAAIAENTVTKTPAARPNAPSAASPSPAMSRTVAVVDVLPPADGSRDWFRASATPAGSAAVPSSDLPPAADDLASTAEETDRSDRPDREPAHAGPGTLARPRKSHATPTPAPEASASPDGVTANQGGASTPAVSSATPSPEFTEKYEAAYVKFLEKNYPETLTALDEADKIQPGQSQSISLRFKAHYALAYIEYRKQNYPGALAELDLADQAQKNADSYNLRGLIFSKQHNYDQAETLFHKAVTTDPGLWAAKFNYAELPFNRGNYTDARTRFEELFSQTDAARQPREAELTQYKVFLTLLLEGKVEAASTFMDHLTFSGATPARYFCNAALNFRAGTVDKAKNWIDDARKEYPPQLVAIFIESFYRLGWMADPNAAAGTAVAQATPVGTPIVTTSGTQPTTVATATAAPSATPFVVAAASPLPTPVLPSVPTAAPRPAASASPAIVVAVASPTPTPLAVVIPTPTVVPRPVASASPAIVAVATPSASPARPVAVASVSPTPTASASPVAVAVVPTASPSRSVAAPSATPHPAASVPPVVVVATPAATPVRPVATATATPATAQATPRPASPAPSAAPAVNADATDSRKNARHLLLALLVGVVLLQTLVNVFQMLRLLSQRNAALNRRAARKRALAQSPK